MGERELSRADFAGAVACTRNGSGEPLWGMIVDAASGGKTEIIRMTAGVADASLDEFTSAALLSFSKAKNPQRVGVLTRIPGKALITIADFSTVLASSDRGLRDQLFSDLRRVYDGELNRDLGNMPERAALGRAASPCWPPPRRPSMSSAPTRTSSVPAGCTTGRSPSSNGGQAGGQRAGGITERQLEANRAKAARDLFAEMAQHGQAAYPAITLPDEAEHELGDIAVAAAICRQPGPPGRVRPPGDHRAAGHRGTLPARCPAEGARQGGSGDRVHRAGRGGAGPALRVWTPCRRCGSACSAR